MKIRRGAPTRRLFQRGALLLLLGIPALSGPNQSALSGANDVVSGSLQRAHGIPAAKCGLLLKMAGQADGPERAFALAGLAHCAPSPEITGVLRNAVLLDDYAARTNALESIGAHLRADLVPFLTALFYGGDMHAGDVTDRARERVLLYTYLERLAAPVHRAELLSIFRRGLYGTSNSQARAAVLEFLGRHGFLPERFARERRILLSSLRGLGKLRAIEEWPRMQPFLAESIKDPQVLTAALEGAAQLPFKTALADKVAAQSSHLLFHANSRVRGAAIRFYAELPSVVATERLLVMYVKLNPALQRELLEASIRKRLLQDGMGGTPGIVLIRARLHDVPTERGAISGVLEEYTIVYRDRTQSPRHRLRPTGTTPGPEANWHQVRTSSGLRGWLHAHRTLYPSLAAAPR